MTRLSSSISSFRRLRVLPLIALRGFERIHLEPGASQKVHFELKARDLGMVTEDGIRLSPKGTTQSASGVVSPTQDTAVATGHFHIDGQYALPE